MRNWIDIIEALDPRRVVVPAIVAADLLYLDDADGFADLNDWEEHAPFYSFNCAHWLNTASDDSIRHAIQTDDGSNIANFMRQYDPTLSDHMEEAIKWSCYLNLAQAVPWLQIVRPGVLVGTIFETISL